MLCDWHVQVCMLDYDVDPEKGKKVLAQLCDKLETHFGVWNASFTLTDCGVISDIFEAKIQSNLEGYWDEFFDKEHSFFVTAINTQLDEPLTWRIERGECTFDYSTDFVDAYGNDCELDTTKVVLFGTAGKERISVCPVKKMIETGESEPGDCFKVPALFENLYDEEDISTDEFCDFLHIPECGMYGELGGYLLDKDGKRITALKDFDHSEPDEDGNVYYPVPQSDFVDGDEFKPLTPEARQNGKQSWGCKSDKAAFPSHTLFVQGRHCNARNGGAVAGRQPAQPGNPGGAHRGAVRQNSAGRVEEKPAGRSAGHGATLERTAQAFGNSAFGAVRRASGACMAESVLLICSSGTKFADTNEN